MEKSVGTYSKDTSNSHHLEQTNGQIEALRASGALRRDSELTTATPDVTLMGLLSLAIADGVDLTSESALEAYLASHKVDKEGNPI
jgi:hypothetical protein